MIAALVVVTLILAGLCVYLAISKDRAVERLTKEFALERGALLNRIQAPETAPFLDAGQEDEPQYAHFEDDEHFAS